MSEHTPGPWQVEIVTPYDEPPSYLVVAKNGVPYSTDELEANARLIAAAPMMLEALALTSVVYGALGRNYRVTEGVIIKVDAAIAAATGDEP